MEAEQPQVAKKRVVKKKNNEQSEVPVQTEVPVESQSENVQPVTEEPSQDDQSSYIPSSRIKNYISKEKLNKHIDSIIAKLKDTESAVDLNSLLSEDLQSKLGSVIKQKEEKQEEININTLAVELLSKQKFKFSNTSFKVLSVFLDLLVEDITLNVMDEIIKNKKSIINLKYVFSGRTDSPLYEIYSTLPTFISESSALSKSTQEVEEVQDSAEVTEETSEEEPAEDVPSHSINFEFYVRKICNKLKKNKEEYSKIKVSNNYQKFCSNLILEFLDRVAPMTTIVLEVMTTKTITNLVFETILKLQLYNNPHCEAILSEVKTRLS
jgi:hypothetical protein